MARQSRNKGRKPARPIRTKRDFEGAAAVAKKMAGDSGLDSTAELRLKALLRELDRFDDAEEDADSGFVEDPDYPGPRRRWSDGGADSDEA